jgi:hypothetical protein
MKINKAEIYQTLYQMNAAFAVVTESCQKLQQTGIFKAETIKLFPSFVQELQAEINRELLNPLESIEEKDWTRHGKARQKWERYLRGPSEPQRRKK